MTAFLRLPILFPALLLLVGAFAALPARAADPCPGLRAQSGAADMATRIAAIACEENHAWFRAFIDADGRGGGQVVYEAENDVLADGMPAWKKVASYWSGSGLPGHCTTTGPACRHYVVDTPWSAAFVSWVMRRAGVPGFTASARHADYVRTAMRQPLRDPYRLSSPHDAIPEAGDLLCYVRAQSRTLGHRGLLDRLDGNAGLPMHCDIVVGAENGMAWLVGGNVQQAVTLRMLRLDGQGRFADLPLRDASDAPCSPDAPAQCNLNRQDWAALLKLQVERPSGSLLAANAP